MSRASALSWYQKYKDTPAYVARKRREQAAKKSLTGNNYVSLKFEKKRKVRYGVVADMGYVGYKRNGVSMTGYHL